MLNLVRSYGLKVLMLLKKKTENFQRDDRDNALSPP